MTTWPATSRPRRGAACWRGGRAAATPDALRAAGDGQSHEFLAAELGRLPPRRRRAVRGGPDDPARLAADRVWIVDPLDGTREFGEQGRTDWAVHVALWERGELTAGAVALPAQGRVLSTAEPPPCPARRAAGAGEPASPSAADRGQPDPAARAVAARWPRSSARAGAAGLGRREGRRGDRRRGRRLRARRRPVRVGLGRAGRGGAGRRAARLPDRRLAAASTTRPTPGCRIS